MFEYEFCGPERVLFSVAFDDNGSSIVLVRISLPAALEPQAWLLGRFCREFFWRAPDAERHPNASRTGRMCLTGTEYGQKLLRNRHRSSRMPSSEKDRFECRFVPMHARPGNSSEGGNMFFWIHKQLLRRGLGSDQHATQKAAIDRIAAYRAADVGDLIEAAMSCRSPGVREQAVQLAAGRDDLIRPEQSVQVFTDALQDKDRRVAERAIGLLTASDRWMRDGQVIALLRAYLAGASHGAKERFLKSLAKVKSGHHVKLLATLLADPSPDIWYPAATLLVELKYGPKTPGESERLDAAKLAADLFRGYDLEKRVPNLVKAMAATSPAVQVLVVRGLTKFCEGSKKNYPTDLWAHVERQADARIVPTLLRLLGGEPGSSKGCVSPCAASTVKVLTIVLRKNAAAVSADALQAIAALGEVSQQYSEYRHDGADGAFDGDQQVFERVECSEVKSLARAELSRRGGR